jgi:hypothetical protein
MKSSKFNIAHLVPHAGNRSLMHGLYGYREVIETMRWGLSDLGYEVTVTENSFRGGCVNIVLGAQMLADADLQRLPPESVIYNFEQIGEMRIDALKPEIRTVANRFRIWEYSEANLATWQMIGTGRDVVEVPVGWAPVLNRIAASDPQDIDVLLYGTPAPLRLDIFNELSHVGMTCVFVCGIYGNARDELIARAKIVLNINHRQSRIFEIVRVSYLLANAKAVVADRQPGAYIEPLLEGAVAFCAPDRVLAQCEALLDDESARRELEARGRAAIEQRPISPILAAALERSGLG